MKEMHIEDEASREMLGGWNADCNFQPRRRQKRTASGLGGQDAIKQ
jgi:hypothetical protein